jgi:hypothetical protein
MLGDFDGDGKTDRAFVDRDGRWHVVCTETGQPPAHIPWGSKAAPGWDDPANICLGDFDGDGKIDRVYVPPDGKWHVICSSTGQPPPNIPWGSQIPGWGNRGIYFGDFDGDGKTDRVLITPDGKWHVVCSSTGQPPPTIPWGSQIPGWPGAGIMLGDFDGDGKTDRAFVDRDGRWHVVCTETGQPPAHIPWGSKAAPGWDDPANIYLGDFDGDGKTDRAYVASDGEWHVILSSTGQPPPNIPWGSRPSFPSATELAINFGLTSAFFCTSPLGCAFKALTHSERLGCDPGENCPPTIRERLQNVYPARTHEGTGGGHDRIKADGSMDIPGHDPSRPVG